MVHTNHNIYVLQRPGSWPKRIGALVMLTFFGYLDCKYIKNTCRENDQFNDRSRYYGDWRARNQVQPQADPEVLNG